MLRIKRTLSLWRTATFRLAMIFATIFGFGAAILLIVLDFGVARFAEEELHDALRHQMAIMRADAQLEGGAALANILAEHVRTDSINRYYYLVIPPSGEVFNSGIPEEVKTISGFGTLQATASDVSRNGEISKIGVIVLTERMPDGTFMAVGRESSYLNALRSGLNRIAIWGSISLILLAIIAGLFIGMLFLRRLEHVNSTTGRIIEGNLSERLPSIGFGQEFDVLVRNLNEMLDRLEAAIAGMRQISTDFAHDLRGALTRLRNQLEELESSSDTQKTKIESAIEEADSLLSLFNAMLRLARLEAGSIQYDMITVDLAEIIRRAIAAYLPAAEDGGRQLLCNFDKAYPIIGDPALLSQLIANLIDNGLCHTPPNTTIEIELLSEADAVILKVKDDGIGVAEAEILNLTKRFYRTDQSRTNPGTGLGLSLVAAIVELHRAEMKIKNRYPGLLIEITFKHATL